MGSGQLPAISPPPPHTPAFGIGMPPLPAFFLLLLLLAGFVPPAAAQSTPTASLQPGGVLTMMEHAGSTGVYFSENREDFQAKGIAVSGDLLFIAGLRASNLSVRRVNAEAGTLSQTALYRDGGLDGKGKTIDGLYGVVDLAVSGDGKLLFVIAELDDALSVWRVNAEAGTLSQTAVYRNGDRDDAGKTIGGLGTARGVAVSDDGKLLFVIGAGPGIFIPRTGALSVWRINAEAGTITQTMVYLETPMNGLDEGFNVVASDNLLFVIEGAALGVWRVNAEAGTLSQTALYRNGGRDDEGKTINGLLNVRSVAVSGDGALLFVAGFAQDVLSVWRVNASSGTLSQTALYQDSEVDERDDRYIREVDGRFDGLNQAIAVAVSGNLLFVTAPFDNALSVWRVNASSGTLSQAVLYQNGGLDGEGKTINSLDRAEAIAVSDGLLFVAATNFRGTSAISVWQIFNAGVPREEPTVIRVQSDLLVAEEVMVTVTAQNGVDSVPAMPVTLSPSTLFADAIFPLGTLSPGRWIFTAQAQPPALLNTEAARTAVRVIPLLSLELQQKQFALGNTVTLTVRAIAGVPMEATYEIFAENITLAAENAALEQTTSTITTVEHPANAASYEVSFPGEEVASLGQWEFSIRLPSISPFRIGDGSTATAQIVLPLLRLVPLQQQFAVDSTVILTVRADAGALMEVTYDILAVNTATAAETTISVVHPTGVTAQEVAFPSRLFSSTGQWEFSILLPDNSPFRVADSSTAIVPIVLPLLQLVPPQEQLGLGSTVILAVRAETGPPTTISYTVVALLNTVSAIASSIAVTHPAGVITQEVSFSAQQIASPGPWEFSISLPPGSPFRADESTTVRILPPPPALSLQPGGVLTMMGPAMPTQVYFSPETDGLEGASGAAVSGDLLFVTGFGSDALSVWRVNESSDTLSPIVVYRNDVQDGAGKTIDGLEGVINTAVSGDGELLFVMGQFDNALSVWRVNAEAGTLTQTALYQDIQIQSTSPSYIENVAGRFDGLSGVRGVAVSDKLLFVTGVDDEALSVWRINAEAGTLSQTALYQDSDVQMDNFFYIAEEEIDGRFDGLNGAINVTVSGDGELLFVPAEFDDTLSVWRVNAEAGTLSRTALYQNGDPDDAGKTIGGLNGAINLAVSGDGELLFVTSFNDNALSVWRVNAEAGTLSQAALYQDLNAFFPIAEVDGRFDGLRGAIDAALSSDGKSLFVTGFSDNTLSVWRVNAEAGTLRQTALYRDGENRIDGLNGVFDAVLSSNGELLFVTASSDNALSVWPINDVTVPLEMQTVIRVQSDMPVDQEVMVTVTAQNGADSVAAMPVTLSADSLFEEAIFPAGTLSPGRWIFTAQAQPPNALDASAARAAVQVLNPLLSLESQQQQFALGSTVALTLRTIKGLTEDTTHSITAVNTASAQTSSTITVMLPANTTQQEVFFPGEEIARLGQWEFFISSLLPSSPFRVGDSAKILIFSQLQLVPLQEQLAVGSTVTLTVHADTGVPVDTAYSITARNTASTQTSFTIAVMLPANTTQQEVSFPGEEIASLGQWEFFISSLPPGSSFRAVDSATILIFSLLRLVPEQDQYVVGSAITLTVRTEVAALTSVSYTIAGDSIGDGPTSRISRTTTHPAGDTEHSVTFADAMFSSPGQWEFFIQPLPDSPFQVGDGATAIVRIFRPLLQLVPLQQQFAVDSTVILTVRADAAVPTEATYEIFAENMASALTSPITVTHPADVAAQEVSFPSQLFSSTGQWEFSILLPADSPFQIGDGATVNVRIIIPLLQLVPLQQQFAVGSTVILTVQADAAAPTEATYEIFAENMASALTSSITVTHPADVAAQEVSFPSQLFSSAGQWEFSILLPADSPFQIGDGSTATVRIIIPLLSLEPQQKEFAVGSTVLLTVQADAAAPMNTTYSITARNTASEQISFTITVGHPANTTAQQVSIPGQRFSSAGQWEFSILLPADSPFQIGDGSTATVRIITPLQLVLPPGQLLTAGNTVTLTVQLDIEVPTIISYGVIAHHAVAATTFPVFTMHPADTTTHSVSFSGEQIASPGQWQFSILPADAPIEGGPITVTISLDFIQPQGIINADDLVFALRYLVLCGGSAEGCEANKEDLVSLARNLNPVRDEIENLPAALQLPDLSEGGEERPATNWFTLLLGLQGLPVELLFPDSEQEQRQRLENAIRSMLPP